MIIPEKFQMMDWYCWLGIFQRVIENELEYPWKYKGKSY